MHDRTVEPKAGTIPEAPERWAKFGGMTWPLPNPELEWTLRYGEASRQQMLVAASILSAYAELVWCPATKRAAIIRELRTASTRERRARASSLRGGKEGTNG